LKEAEAWLSQYSKKKDSFFLNQAFDLYCKVYNKIEQKISSLSIIHLENVSPKLLEMKNNDLAIPGLYKPNQPIVKIAGFASKLQVLYTKQKPRKLLIYGSDGKEYLIEIDTTFC
jgi:serine/threonine-protein kinase mTOR